MATSKELSQFPSHGSAEVVNMPCTICHIKDKIVVKSSVYCVDCDANMCAPCTQVHARFPTLAQHQVVDISRAPRTPPHKPQRPTQQCDKHCGMVVDIYCQQDDAVLCETCVNVYHRNCAHMQYIPKVAKGISKDQSSEPIKTVSELITQLKQMKSSKEDDITELDKAEATSCQEVQDLRARLHKYVDNLADAADATIKSEFQKHKGEVQKEIAIIDDQTDATETFSKIQNDCKSDNESELVYIKQAGKVEMAVQQTLETLKQSKVDIPTYKIKNNIEKSMKDIESLGQFVKMTSAKLNTNIKVRDAKDRSICVSFGICLLPDASFIMADYSNKSVKLFDPSFKLAGYLDMPALPYDVCYTDNNEVAATLTLVHKVQFVSVGSTIKMAHSFKVGDVCRGIAYLNGELFVCCGSSRKPADACIRVYSLSGTLLRTIQCDQAGQNIFSFPRYITISTCGGKLHVTDDSKRLVTTDRAGKLLATYTDPDLDNPYGVCCLDSGDLLICDYQANCVHHVSEDDRKLSKLLTDNDGIANPQAVCYDSASARLFVSMAKSDFIKVYDIQ